MPPEPNPPKVFISYSHDSRLHLDRVLELADRLRQEGIDCNLDQYEPAPAEGWPRWMDRQFQDADFILVVCTETYCRRFEGREEHGKGQGVKWEGAIITDELYSNESVNKRFIPVLFSNDDAQHVPRKLQHYMRHLLAGDEGYEELYRRLTNQPRVIKPSLGKLRSFEPVNKLPSLPSEDRRQEFAPIEEKQAPKPQRQSAPSAPVIVPPPPPRPRVSHQNFTEDLGHGVKLEMIALPGGTFQMGSNEYGNEKPIHPVTLSPFHIGKHQITQAQWQAVMRDNPSHFKGDNLPVERVSWQIAFEFCLKLSEKTGKEYRLPTEAEWEYACRAGSTTRYCFGDDEASLNDYAYFKENSGGKTHPVGEKNPNGWGLHDFHGNVWEWCLDYYNAEYYEQRVSDTPQEHVWSSYRVVRGGAWVINAANCRSACRGFFYPEISTNYLGVRVVCVARTP